MDARSQVHLETKRRVVDALRANGPISQADIVRRTGLSRTTVFEIVRELELEDMITRTGFVSRGGQRGRPGQLLALRHGNGVAVGVDIHRSHVRVAVADLDERVIAETYQELPEPGEARSGLAATVQLVRQTLDEASIALGDVVGVGVGVPGPIDSRTGVIGSPTLLRGWVGVHVADALQQRLGAPVYADNSANLGALAEFLWGAGRGATNLAYLKVDAGIGSGLVMDGRLFRGASGLAGEVGHITLDEDGLLCSCGNRGCLETMATTTVLVELFRKQYPSAGSIDALLQFAENGDVGAKRLLEDAGHKVGVAAASLCNLFNPDRLVLGGSLGASGALLLHAVRRTIRRRALWATSELVEVVSSTLGPRAEPLGGVLLVLREEQRFDLASRPVPGSGGTAVGAEPA